MGIGANKPSNKPNSLAEFSLFIASAIWISDVTHWIFTKEPTQLTSVNSIRKTSMTDSCGSVFRTSIIFCGVKQPKSYLYPMSLYHLRFPQLERLSQILWNLDSVPPSVASSVCVTHNSTSMQ